MSPSQGAGRQWEHPAKKIHHRSRARRYRQACSDKRLLASLLGGPPVQDKQKLAERLLADTGGLQSLGCLEEADFVALGLGQAAANRLAAAFEIGRRASAAPKASVVDSPAKAFSWLSPQLSKATHERFVVLVVDAANRVCGVRCVAEGGRHCCPVDVASVFKAALHVQGAAVIVAHNHPSGVLTPSAADAALTVRLQQAGTLLGVPLLDHMIVGQDHYVSLAALNMLMAQGDA